MTPDHTSIPEWDAPTAVDVVVVGAGLAGLVAAATAARAGRSVAVIEPHPLGGRARCDQVDGFTLNRGPRALYLGGGGRPVLERLGVGCDSGGPPTIHGGLIRRAGTTHRFPSGPGSLLRTTLLRGRDRLRAGMVLGGLTRPDRKGRDARLQGRTVGDWIAEVAPQAAVADLLGALVRLTTYVDAPDTLDAHAAVSQVRMGLDPGVRYLDGGWQSLVDDLAAIIAAGGGRHVRARAEAVYDTASGITVTTSTGEVRAAVAVLALGSPDAAVGLLGSRPEEWPELGPPATAACLEVGLRRRSRHPFLFGADEPLYVSTHAPPARLAPEGGAVVHALRYHHVDDPLSISAQRDHLRAAVADAGVDEADVVVERFQARMIVAPAIPLARAGGLAGRPSMELVARPHTLLAGDWVGPTGMLADTALSSGEAAGRRAVELAATLVPT